MERSSILLKTSAIGANRCIKYNDHALALLANYLNVNIHQTDLWDPNADLNDDGVIDILDAILLSNHFNQHQG
jgi:hypothetical protein